MGDKGEIGSLSPQEKDEIVRTGIITKASNILDSLLEKERLKDEKGSKILATCISNIKNVIGKKVVRQKDLNNIDIVLGHNENTGNYNSLPKIANALSKGGNFKEGLGKINQGRNLVIMAKPSEIENLYVLKTIMMTNDSTKKNHCYHLVGKKKLPKKLRLLL